MTTITKERIELFIKNPLDNGLTRGEQMEVARIALASLEAELVGAFHIAEQQVDGTSDYLKDGEWPIDNGIIEVYAAPPAQVVPDEMTEHGARRATGFNRYIVAGYVEGWNACRAAMLQSQSEQPQNAQQNIPENIPGGNSPVIPEGWINCSERMPVIGELNWRTSFPLLVTCEIGVIPAYYGFVSVNGDRHYGFMESLKYGDDSGGHPQTNEYGLISNVTHWMPLP